MKFKIRYIGRLDHNKNIDSIFIKIRIFNLPLCFDSNSAFTWFAKNYPKHFWLDIKTIK